MSYAQGHLVETVPPALEPITLEELKLHLRIVTDVDDEYLASLITTTRQAIENVTSLSLIQRQFSLYLDQWPSQNVTGWWDGMREGAVNNDRAAEVWLPKPPLSSVVQILTYDANGASSVYNANHYFVDHRGIPGSIVLKEASAVPQPGQVANGIEIKFIAGYGSTAVSVPAPLRQAIKLLAAALYEARGEEDATRLIEKSAAAALMHPYKRLSLT